MLLTISKKDGENLNVMCPYQQEDVNCGGWCALFELVKTKYPENPFDVIQHCCKRVIGIKKEEVSYED